MKWIVPVPRWKGFMLQFIRCVSHVNLTSRIKSFIHIFKCHALQYYDFYYQSSCIFYWVAPIHARTPAEARNSSAQRPAVMDPDILPGTILLIDPYPGAQGQTSHDPGRKMAQRPNHWGKLCLNWFAFKIKSTLVIFWGWKLKCWNAYFPSNRFPNFETRCEPSRSSERWFKTIQFPCCNRVKYHLCKSRIKLPFHRHKQMNLKTSKELMVFEPSLYKCCWGTKSDYSKAKDHRYKVFPV